MLDLVALIHCSELHYTTRYCVLISHSQSSNSLWAVNTQLPDSTAPFRTSSSLSLQIGSHGTCGTSPRAFTVYCGEFHLDKSSWELKNEKRNKETKRQIPFMSQTTDLPHTWNPFSFFLIARARQLLKKMRLWKWQWDTKYILPPRSKTQTQWRAANCHHPEVISGSLV